MNYKELFITQFLSFEAYAAVIIDLETLQYYNALFLARTSGGAIVHGLSQTGEPISFKVVQRLADKSEDGSAVIYRRAPSQKDLDDARCQAQQLFQRGGLDRKQAYAVYGLDPDGNQLK